MVRKIKAKQILELRESMSMNEIVKSRRMSKSSVSEVCKRARNRNITFDDVMDKTEEEVYALLFPEKLESQTLYKNPDYDYIHSELRKVGVTLQLLHAEYKELCKAEGSIAVSYSKFCRDYRKYAGAQNSVSHIEHKPGDRIEVDWSGPTMEYVDKSTGEIKTVYLFVSDLVYSRYAYVEPRLDMKMQSWLECNINMWSYYGGVSRIVICDNLKTGVVEHPKNGEVVLTADYEALMSHYSTAVIPAAVKAPRQKNSVEGTVGDVATAIIAKLRNKTFYSFQALKTAVSQKLSEFNNEEFQVRDGSRKSVFEEEEKIFLKPLPTVPFELGVWVLGHKIYPNYHVSFEKNFYSCPYRYKKQNEVVLVDIKATPTTVSLYIDGLRVKTHPRFTIGVKGKYRTDKNDMPLNYGFAEWTSERLLNWARKIGMAAATTIQRIIDSREIPEQSFNSALAVLHLSNSYGASRLEKACELALKTVNIPRYHHLKAILSTKQDQTYIDSNQRKANEVTGCLRGSDYYASLIKEEDEDVR